jgi:hypothetical protein
VPPALSASLPRPEVNRLLRKVAGPLVLYHVLLLTGAFLLLDGRKLGNASWEGCGWVLILSGILLEVGILVWTAGPLRTTAASLPSTVRSGSGAADRPLEVRLCAACGWMGHVRSRLCPRCARPTLPKVDLRATQSDGVD